VPDLRERGCPGFLIHLITSLEICMIRWGNCSQPVRMSVHGPKSSANEPRSGRRNNSRELERLLLMDHNNPLTFAPVHEPNGSWYSVIEESQNPPECSRFLLVYLGSGGAGVGMLATLIAPLLLHAMRTRRILMEVHLDESWRVLLSQTPSALKILNKTIMQPPLWCEHPPYTFACAYMPWTHCELPKNLTGARVIPVSHKWPLPVEPDVLIVDWTWVFQKFGGRVLARQGNVCSKTAALRASPRGIFVQESPPDACSTGRSVLPDAYRFLFRPRPWVRELADCVMRSNGIARSTPFLSVHLRASAAKQKDLVLFGDRSPAHLVHQNQLDYGMMLSLSLTKQLRISHVHVQTASPTLLRDYTQLATGVGLYVAFTRNTRYSDDSWGMASRSDKYKEQNILHYNYEQLLVAAVNAEISTRAAAVLSPLTSMWTQFLQAVAAAPAAGLMAASFSFKCTIGAGRRGYGEMDIVAFMKGVHSGWHPFDKVNDSGHSCEASSVAVACPHPSAGIIASSGRLHARAGCAGVPEDRHRGGQLCDKSPRGLPKPTNEQLCATLAHC